MILIFFKLIQTNLILSCQCERRSLSEWKNGQVHHHVKTTSILNHPHAHDVKDCFNYFLKSSINCFLHAILKEIYYYRKRNREKKSEIEHESNKEGEIGKWRDKSKHRCWRNKWWWKSTNNTMFDILLFKDNFLNYITVYAFKNFCVGNIYPIYRFLELNNHFKDDVSHY